MGFNDVFKIIVKALLDAFLFLVYLIDFIPELFLSETERENRIRKKSVLVSI